MAWGAAANKGYFILGTSNVANAVSQLTANVSGPALKLVNSSTDAAATAINLDVAPGHAPLTVNSSQKVANLNADQVDGKESSEFASASLFGSAVNGQTGTSAGSLSCYLGEVRLFAGSQAPGDWMIAKGQLIPISQNTALFSLLRTSYGGDGQTTFALPDLRGAEPKGAGPAAPYYAICVEGVYPPQ